MPFSKETFERRKNVAALFTSNLVFPTSTTLIAIRMLASQCHLTSLTIADPDKTQWESLTRNKFEGMRLCFGQLVYYQRKSSTKTLEPNMSPGLFLGWRIDPGFRYRNVVRVLNYQEYRARGGNSAVDVPEAEIFVLKVILFFPVGFSRRQALIRGDSPDDLKLPEYALKDVPFPKEGGIASPSTPGLKKSFCLYNRRPYPQVERDTWLQRLHWPFACAH